MSKGATRTRGSILSRLWDSAVFFSHFFKNPIALSTPLQSSRRISRIVRHELQRHGAHRVVELGSGVGRITSAILEAIPPEERLLCVERDRLFCKRLSKRFGDRVMVVQEDARRLPHLLPDSDFADPDGIVCSVPLNTPWACELCSLIADQLPPKGIYIQVSFTSTPIERYFDLIRTYTIAANVPPERVHVAKRNT